ncbi:MAG: glycine--tRNA ligase subunit beta [Nitrospirota bacterium]
MPELLLEIGVEEVPASYIAPAVRALGERVVALLGELHIEAQGLSTYETPRRLAVHVTHVSATQASREVERRGPAVTVAYDAEGNLTKAGRGFLQGAGASEADLIRIPGKKGDYIGVRLQEGGGQTRELLATHLPPLIAGLAFPKSMRWGSGTWRFARPVHWILALLDGERIPFEVDGVESCTTTRGHRFLAPQPIPVAERDSYLAGLRAGAVEPDPVARAAAIRARAEKLGSQAGGRTVVDGDLLDEVAHLVEHPGCVLGRFDDDFLAVPREVLVTSMAKNQRYFPVEDGDGRLLPAFVAVTNSSESAADNVRAGNERVLRARLADARFFWDEDRKRTLHSRVADLDAVALHERLGSVGAKVSRMETLAAELGAAATGVAEADVRRAVQLAKADLTTHMVIEFPKLQGVMGRHYAAHDGESLEVCRAIEEHYWPRFAGDRLPSSDLGRLVAVVDRLDAVCGGFAVGLIPSGSQDPFGLRRAGLGLIQICLDGGWDVDLWQWVDHALAQLAASGVQVSEEATGQVRDFLGQRLSHALFQDGLPEDVVRAVLAMGSRQPVRDRARARALAALRQEPAFTDFALSFKRVHRIIPADFAGQKVDDGVLVEAAERALLEEERRLGDEVAPLRDAGDYGAILARLVTLRPAVDRFFDDILVMADDPNLRTARLSLLCQVRALFDGIADLSQLAVES